MEEVAAEDLDAAALDAAAAGRGLRGAVESCGPLGSFSILPDLADATVKLTWIAASLAAAVRPGKDPWTRNDIGNVPGDLSGAASALAAAAGAASERQSYSRLGRAAPPRPAPPHVQDAAGRAKDAIGNLASILNRHQAAAARGPGSSALGDPGIDDSQPYPGGVTAGAKTDMALARIMPLVADLTGSMASCAALALPREPRMTFEARHGVEEAAAALWRATHVIRTDAAAAGVASDKVDSILQARGAQTLAALSFPATVPLPAASAGERRQAPGTRRWKAPSLSTRRTGRT